MERSAQTGTASQVHFRFSRFSAPYRSRLLQGLCDLQDYCKQELGQDLRVLIRQRRVIDRLLGAYVMDRHASSDGKQLSLVKHALLGCQHLNPRLRGRLAISWENLRVWEEQKVANLRRPLPVPIWVCTVGLSRAHGFTAQDGAVRSQWFIMAILLEIGMLCLLRPGELLKLRHSDFALPGSFFPQSVSSCNKNGSSKKQKAIWSATICLTEKFKRDCLDQRIFDGGQS